MRRAAVLIGVKRTGGGLPVLQDATRSAERMARWARDQGFRGEDVALITDEVGPVSVDMIFEAIRRFNEAGTIEQLIVFFAGHGINVARSERWLLTDAPANANAAVNVSGSADLARWGSIPHVVMISDACRTAAEGIQAQGVTGGTIFPNDDAAELEQPVDQFFACRLGRPAYEIRDVDAATREYKAIYTAALLAALEGTDPTVLDAEGYVRPHPLKKFLRSELGRRLRHLPPEAQLVQVPDAHVASDERAWISRVLGGPPPPRLPMEAPPIRLPPDPAEPPATQPPAPDEAVAPVIGPTFAALLHPILIGNLHTFDYVLRESTASEESGIADIANVVEKTASPFDPTPYEAQCGIRVGGAGIVEVVAGRVGVERVSEEFARIDGPNLSGTVLVVLDRGVGITIPVIPEFIAAVTVDEGEVVDLAYEPAVGTSRWPEFNERAREVRALRAVAAGASREGAFELEGEDAFALARRMQYAKSIDPALAIYAAYAYADIGRGDLIREMYGYMSSDLGAVLFDIALLAREPRGQRRLGTGETFGFAPLLAQGWALLASSRSALPPLLDELARHVLPGSLWTLYNEKGVEQIRQALAQGALA